MNINKTRSERDTDVKLQRLRINVSYDIDLKDISIPKDIFENLVGLYEMDVVNLDPKSQHIMESRVCEWLSDNVYIQEKNSNGVVYEIKELDHTHLEMCQ